MELTVKACELGEPVAVMTDGQIILGEPGQVALVVQGRDDRGAAVTLTADQAWDLAVRLAAESRKARRLSAENGNPIPGVRLRDILRGKQ
jgi:hypothetical protein